MRRAHNFKSYLKLKESVSGFYRVVAVVRIGSSVQAPVDLVEAPDNMPLKGAVGCLYKDGKLFTGTDCYASAEAFEFKVAAHVFDVVRLIDAFSAGQLSVLSPVLVVTKK